jgi:hypothetical protein
MTAKSKRRTHKHIKERKQTMNKKPINAIDKSEPYRNLGIGKVTAPVKPQNEPKVRVIKGSSDLRCKGGKN